MNAESGAVMAQRSKAFESAEMVDLAKTARRCSTDRDEGADKVVS